MLTKTNKKQTSIVLLHQDGDPITFILTKQLVGIGTAITTRTNTWIVTEISNDSAYKDCDLEVTVI